MAARRRGQTPLAGNNAGESRMQEQYEVRQPVRRWFALSTTLIRRLHPLCQAGHMGNRILVGLAAAAMLVSCFVATSGCDKSSRPSPNAPSRPVSDPQSPAPQPSGEIIRLGEPVSGTITSQSICKFGGNDPRSVELCDVFSVTAPDNGTLVAAVRLTPDAATLLRFRTAAGEVIDTFCCSTTTGRVPVQAGSVVQIEIEYVGRPPGYPSTVAPVAYTIETTLVTGDLQPRGDLHVIVFGDTTRTQRLAQARVEVLDGPLAGQVARFDEASGVYELLDLPAGFIHVRASAPGFNPVEAQLIVGAQWSREVVLQRTTPLIDAEHTLQGWAGLSSSPTTRLIRVKIEIVDGPVAGVFTLTDDDMGEYTLSSLPAGVVQVRASYAGRTQTLSVDLSARNTYLPFVF